MGRRKQIIGVGLLLAGAISVPAAAQPAPAPYPQCTRAVTTADSELAHQKYIAGKQDYDEGNYESAIRRFRDAYNLDCLKHELLIIISAAYERRGDKKEAITALETYVSRASTAQDVPTYQAKIENLKKQIAAPAPTVAPTAGPTGTAPAPTAVPEHTAYPWIAVGVGVAAVVAGVVLVATTPANPENCGIPEGTRTCRMRPGQSDDDYVADQEQAGQHADQPVVGGIIIGAGALIAIGGVVWHFLEPTGAKESGRTTKLRPSVTPGYAGFALGGTF